MNERQLQNKNFFKYIAYYISFGFIHRFFIQKKLMFLKLTNN